MTYPTDEETFAARATPEWIREGHLNSIQQFLKRIQDFIGYGGRLHDETGLVMPVGAMLEWPDVAAPSGFLLCDGHSYDGALSAYSDLYAVIGTKYGGFGGTLFNVPDRRGLFTRGYSKVASIEFLPADVNTTLDYIDIEGQEFNRCAFPVRFSTTDTLPAPLAINTTYYTMRLADVGWEKYWFFATSRANALARTKIVLTTQGAGTHTVYPYLEEDKDTRLKMTYGGNDGEDLGSYQPDAFQAHYHALFQNISDTGGALGGINSAWTIDTPQMAVQDATTDGVHGTPRKTYETRPRNVNVNYIIKR